MSQSHGPYADFLMGLWILANIVANIIKVKSLQNRRKQLTSRPKTWSRLLSGLNIYTHTFIYLSQVKVNNFTCSKLRGVDVPQPE